MRGLCFSLYCLIAQILKAIVLGQISWGNITEILSQCRHLADSKFPEEFEWLERSKFYDFHTMHRERQNKLLLHCFVSILKVILSQSLTSLGILGGGGGENPTQCGGKKVPKSSSGLLISAWITDIQIMCLMFKQVLLSGEKVAKQSFVM